MYMQWIPFPSPALTEQREHFLLPLTVLLIWLKLWMHQVSFTSSSYFWYIKPSWLIRPVSNSKELFSGSQRFYLLFQCQSVCFPGILRPLVARITCRLTFSFSLASSRTIYSFSRLFLTSDAFQKGSPYQEFTPRFSSIVKRRDISKTSQCSCCTYWPSKLSCHSDCQSCSAWLNRKP